MKTTTWTKVALAAVALSLFGCEQKLTYSRFETIHEGDEGEVVESILGKPTMRTDQTWRYSDYDRQIQADVYFSTEKKVIGKEWHDPEHGMVGKSPYVNQPGDSHEIRMRETR